jgi:hypothetical protein
MRYKLSYMFLPLQLTHYSVLFAAATGRTHKAVARTAARSTSSEIVVLYKFLGSVNVK